MQTPRQISESLMNKSHDYSVYSGEIVRYIKLQAEFFEKERPNFKSDNATQKAFDNTKDGIVLLTLKMKLKALEKEMSAMKTHLRLLENEAKNLY